MRKFPYLGFNIDYKYLCGRDNYTCQNPKCNKSLEDFQIYFRKIDKKGKDIESNIVLVCAHCAARNDVELRKPLSEFPGRLIVITGPMFSQKSTTTRALYNKYRALFKQQEPAPFVWVKPQIDDRKKDFTKTHDESLFEAYTIDARRPDLSLATLEKYNIVAFDEAQFFSERILYVIQQLLMKGCLVIANGLKLTAKRDLFGVMHYIMAEADEIHSLKSVCNACRLVDYATRTKSFNLNLPSISIGGLEQYYAVCPTCDGGASEKEFLKKSI
jgi:thymidine kinase